MRIWFVHDGTGGTPFLSTKGHEGTRRTATATHLSAEDAEGRGELQRRLQLPFVHEGPRRATKNGNGNTFVRGGHGGARRTATATVTSFCPRRAAKEHEERQRQHLCPRRARRGAENCNGDCNFLLSTKGHEGTRRTATATPWSAEGTEGRGELQRRLQLPFVHEGPRRNTKNGNGNTFVHGGHGGPRRTATATATSFCPRRATKEHEEWQRQHLCPRRTRRAAENCNGDCSFFLSTKGHEGTRRTATATPLSAEDTEGRGELQRRLQLPFVHEGPRRATKNCNGNTFVRGGHGGPRRTATATATSFCPRRVTKEHEGTRRTATATPLSAEGTEGRGELQRRLQLPFVHEGPRRNTKNGNGNTFVRGGHGGPRRTATATATSFCPRRAAKEHEERQRQHLCPRRAAEGHEENLCQIIIWSVHEGTRGTPYVVDADHGRRSRESGEKRSDCASRRPVFVTL